MTEEELLEEGPNIPNASIQPPPMDTIPGPVIPATVNLSNGASASAPSPRAGLSSSNEMATVFNGDWTTVNYRGRRLGRHFMQKGMDEHKAFEIVKAKFSKLAISPDLILLKRTQNQILIPIPLPTVPSLAGLVLPCHTRQRLRARGWALFRHRLNCNLPRRISMC